MAEYEEIEELIEKEGIESVLQKITLAGNDNITIEGKNGAMKAKGDGTLFVGYLPY